MEWYWAWYVLGPDTNTGNTMMTPSLFCPPVWISKGGIKKNSRNIFFKFSPNLFRKAVYIDKGWAVTFSWYLPMSLSDFTPALVWWVDYTMKAKSKLTIWGCPDSSGVVQIAQSGKALSFRRRGPGFESRGQPYPQCFHPTLGMWILVEGWYIGSEPAIDITHAPAGSDTLRGLVGKNVEWYFPAVDQGWRRGGKVVM